MLRIFSKEELKKYDGKQNPAYIAYEDNVYDVSKSFHWQKGIHQAQHLAGKDLTEELKDAPHISDMLYRFPKVGKLAR